jgi:hypothetical protein
MQVSKTIKPGKMFNKKGVYVLAQEVLFYEAHVSDQKVKIKNFNMEA